MRTEIGYACDLCNFLLARHENLGTYATAELPKMHQHLCANCEPPLQGLPCSDLMSDLPPGSALWEAVSDEADQ